MGLVIFIAVVIIALFLGVPIATLVAVNRLSDEQKSNHSALERRLRSIEQRLLKGFSSSHGAEQAEKRAEKELASGDDLAVARAAVTEARIEAVAEKSLIQEKEDKTAPAMPSQTASQVQKPQSPKQPLSPPLVKKTLHEESPKLEPEKQPILVAKVLDEEQKDPSIFGLAEELKKLPPVSTSSSPKPVQRPAYSYSQPTSYEPSALEVRTKEVLGKIWNWIVVGEEYRPKDVSMEYAIATNWLIRVGALIVLFGIGFFLKYSVEQGWLNATGRVVLASLAGGGMVTGGLFLLGGKKYDLFGQGLIGIGVVTLYGTIFAAMRFEHMLQQLPAFALMSVVTALSCGIAVRFNKLLIAMIGTIGGYATPMLLRTGTANLPGLYTYLTILTAGVLVISYAKDWHLVRAASFLGAWGLVIASLASVWSDRAFDFAVIMPFMVGFFVMFSTMNFLHNLVKRKEATLLELGMLWSNAAIFFFIAYALVNVTFGGRTFGGDGPFCCKQFTFVTLGMAFFYVVHIYYFLVKKIEDRVLLSSFFAIASLMLTITVPILISREWLSMTWAIQALVMLWVAQKLDSRFLEVVAGVLYAMVFCMFLGDLGLHFGFNLRMGDVSMQHGYWADLVERLITFGTMLGSFFGASWLLNHKQKSIESLRVQGSNNWVTTMEQNSLAITMSVIGAVLGFLYLNIEFHQTFNYVDKMLTAPAMTVLWIGLGVFLLVQYLRNGNEALLALLGVTIVGLLLKFVFWDLIGWDINPHLCYPTCELKTGLIRLFDFGVIIAALAVVGRLLWDSDEESAHNLSMISIVGSIAMLFGYTSLELNSMLYHLVPGSRAGGVSVLWSLYALAFVSIGIWKNIRALRYAGLALFGIVSVKVFFVDLANVDKAYRIIAFILLGVILICGSLAYMRCRQVFCTTSEEDEKITEEGTN